jgi:hypothetical protein
LLATSCRPFPPPLSTSPSRSFLSSQEGGVIAVAVRFRTASECVMSSFILTPVYHWLQAQHDSLLQPSPPSLWR